MFYISFQARSCEHYQSHFPRIRLCDLYRSGWRDLGTLGRRGQGAQPDVVVLHQSINHHGCQLVLCCWAVCASHKWLAHGLWKNWRGFNNRLCWLYRTIADSPVHVCMCWENECKLNQWLPSSQVEIISDMLLMKRKSQNERINARVADNIRHKTCISSQCRVCNVESKWPWTSDVV